MKATKLIAGVALAAVAGCGSPAARPADTAPVEPAPAPTPAPAADPTPAPAEPADLVFPDEEFRARQPQAGPPRPFNLPEIKTFDLSGIKVYLVERHTLPTVQMRLSVPGGSDLDPRGKEGLASLCVDLMDEGTATLDKVAFNEALADTASTVSARAGGDRQYVFMSSLSKHLEPTLALWKATLFEPGLRQKDLERLVKSRLEQLKQLKGSPGSLQSRLGSMAQFGATHPYGRFTTEASYGKIKLADCKRYHARSFKRKGAELYVVGDITEEQIKEKVGPALANLKGRTLRVRKPPRARPMRGRIFFVDFPGAAQSALAMGHLGPGRKAADFFPTTIMARILGGGFASRINMNLREDKGYTYGAGGGFRYNRLGSALVTRTSVRTNVTKESLIELHKEFVNLHKGNPTATTDELQREKNGAILALPARFATGRQALSAYSSLVYWGLPLDYYNSYTENVNAVTAEQVNAAAARHLDPAKASFMVVGDGKTVLPGLYELVAAGSLGAGNLVILSDEGKVLDTVTPAQAKKKLAEATPAAAEGSKPDGPPEGNKPDGKQ